MIDPHGGVAGAVLDDSDDHEHTPGDELSPAVRGALLDPAVWQDGLHMFSLATRLAVALVDADGRALTYRNPRPLWSLFRNHKPPDPRGCLFALSTGEPCTCIARALATGRPALARDRTGLVHFAVPLMLGAHRLGALLGGQVFTQFPEQLALEHVARLFGLSPSRVWEQARLEQPVKRATLDVYAELLATLGRTFLQTHYDALTEAGRLAEMTRLRERAIGEIADRHRAEEELRESDRRKNEFLAMLAHELRNPLAPIRNALELLQLRGDDPRAVQSASEIMERQVGHMVRLIDDLLDVSRISRGRIELRKGRVELASVIHHAIEAARPSTEDKQQELTATLPPDPIYVEADPARLAQVVGNLLSNACKFTGQGGRIELTVSIAECGLSDGPAMAEIRVRDTGIGIAPDQLRRIFDMFVQADTSLERSVSGLGIGLTLVRMLVELHGGTVDVQSAGVGQGSEFVVRLPIAVEAPARPPEPGVSQPPPTPSRRILVVDDNRDSAETLALLLTLTGHETQIAHDGLETIERAELFRPDVVLLDIGLPKLNGYEAARRIREQPWGRDMRLVALTGWGQEEDRKKSRECGFDDHLVKPVDHDALRRVLAEAPRSMVVGHNP